MISICIDNNSKCDVNISTFGGSFITSFQFVYEDNGEAFVSSSSNLSDATLSKTSQDFQKDIWLFDDSYFGVSENRVIGQLKNLGFSNFLVDGLAGQGSDGAYNELIK